jgi:hypothetical protein
VAKRIREAQSLSKPQLAIKMLKATLAKALTSSYLCLQPGPSFRKITNRSRYTHC